MKSRYAPYSIRLILILIGMSGILLSWFTHTWEVITMVIFIAQLVCLELMLKESTIFLTIYFRLISICIAIYLVGALLKILPYDGGDWLLLISLTSIALIYTIRTSTKRGIQILDILKAGWVIVACANTIFRILHWQYANLLSYLNLGLFVAMFVFFLITPEQLRKEDLPYRDKPIDQVD